MHDRGQFTHIADSFWATLQPLDDWMRSLGTPVAVRRWLTVLTGLVTGLATWICVLASLSQWGSTWQNVCGWGVALSLAAGVSQWLLPVVRNVPLSRPVLAASFAACALAYAPATRLADHWLNASSLGNQWAAAAVVITFHALLSGGLLTAVRLLMSLAPAWLFSISFAVGTLVVLPLLYQGVGLFWISMSGLALAAVALYDVWTLNTSPGENTPSGDAAAMMPTTPVDESQFPATLPRFGWGELLNGVAGGILLSVVLRDLHQFTSVTALLLQAELFAVGLGLGLGQFLAVRGLLQRLARRAGGWLSLAWLSLAMSLAAESVVAYAVLELSAVVSWGGLAIVLRSPLITLPLLMLAVIASAAHGPTSFGTQRSSARSGLPGGWHSRVLLGGTVGLLLGRFFVLPAAGFQFALAGAAGLISVLVMRPHFVSARLPVTAAIHRSAPRPGWRIVAGTLGSLLLMCAAAWCHHPELTARTLFSSDVFAASRRAEYRPVIAGWDGGRTVDVVETPAGTIVTSVRQGHQLQLRQNGFPAGQNTLNPALASPPPGDVMSAVVPMLLTPQADHVLVLGYGSGVTLRAVTEFPVRSAMCIDANPQVRALLERHDAFRVSSVSQDSRVTLVTADPLLAVRQSAGPFDVIIDIPEHSSLISSGGRYSREYYRQVRRMLGAAGVFAQRLSYSDYGVGPVSEWIATVSAEFPHALIFEADTGEFVLLASMTELAPTPDTLFERATQPQVVRLLSELAWDWTMPLNLSYLQAVRGTDHAPLQLGATHPRHLVAWPVELARWGAKRQELQALMATGRHRLLDRFAGHREEPLILSHLADLAARVKVLDNNPDEPWAYRTAMKEKLQQHPRSALESVRGAGLQRRRHPEDEARLSYLATLGAAASAARWDDPAITTL